MQGRPAALARLFAGSAGGDDLGVHHQPGGGAGQAKTDLDRAARLEGRGDGQQDAARADLFGQAKAAAVGRAQLHRHGRRCGKPQTHARTVA